MRWAAARVRNKETLVGRSTDSLTTLLGDNIGVEWTGDDSKADYDTLGMSRER